MYPKPKNKGKVMLRYNTGSVLSEDALKDANVLIHLCHCHNKMGRGVALQIAEMFPALEEADKATPYGSRDKLGKFSSAFLNNPYSEDLFIGFNVYGQFRYGRDEAHIDYDALEEGLLAISKFLSERPDLKIIMPKIGSDRAGGDWTKIEAIISRTFTRHRVTVWFL